METKHIHIRDYDYPLPDDRIAKFPLSERDASKLLVYDGGRISETHFRSLPELLPEGSLMVFNNTRVIQARLHFRKKTAQPPSGEDPRAEEIVNSKLSNSKCLGALIEVFLLEPAQPAEYQENFAAKGHCSWYCLVGTLKKWGTRHKPRDKVRMGREPHMGRSHRRHRRASHPALSQQKD